MGRLVTIKDSTESLDLYSLETNNFGNPSKSVAASVGETDIDTLIPINFYPKQLSIEFSVTFNTDFYEIVILDLNKNVVKKLSYTHYVATQTEVLLFADIRDAIPSIIFQKNFYLRIAFHNVSANPYTVNSNWDVWGSSV